MKKKMQILVLNFKAKAKTQCITKKPSQTFIVFYHTSCEDSENECTKGYLFFIYGGDCHQLPSVERREDKIFDQLVFPWNPNHFYTLAVPLDDAI